MNSSNSIVCKNCGNVFKGNYCNNCRQSAKTHRITWHEIGHGLFHAFFHADKGLLFTIRELTTRPGKTIREYLEGKRANHFNPLLFLILTGTLSTFIFSMLHLKLPNDDVPLDKIHDLSSVVAEKYFIVVGLFFIFLLTVTDYFFYFNRKYVIPEIIISNAFQSGQILTFTILMIPLFLLQNFVFNIEEPLIDIRSILKLAVIGFLFYARFQIYEARGNYFLMGKIIVQLGCVYFLYNTVIEWIVEHWIKRA